jgi:hypothetical protein
MDKFMRSLKPIQKYFSTKLTPNNNNSNDYKWLYLKAINAEKKSNTRLEKTKELIEKFIVNKRPIVKYQLSGYYEAKIIKKYCDDKKYICSIVSSDKLMKNQIELINQGNYFCCDECDYRPSFINKKVPCVYVEIKKNL